MPTLLFALQAGYRSRTHLAFCRQVRCEVILVEEHELDPHQYLSVLPNRIGIQEVNRYS